MPNQSFFHSSSGGCDFLGLRTSPTGKIEIVYDDGVKRRMVWRVQSESSVGRVGDALRSAVDKPRVLQALYCELKKRSIAIDVVPV
ncbi:MAG: hypothetical protein H6901_01645 [Rhodobacteraceae bacterium]|nr:hypothetical protein [Paracoccaceae bacterium]MCP5340903.1 hypothetical protein [Paracoccaceae bacterium]